MTRRRSSVFADALLALALVLVAAALVLLLLSLDGRGNVFGFRGSIEVLSVGFAGTGWALASRRPENPIGWILLLASVASGVQAIAQEWPVYAVEHGHEAGIALGRWLDTWIWVPIVSSVGVYVFLLFPTGRPPSPRWRPVAWIGTVGMVLFTVAFAFGSDVEELGTRNPFFDLGAAVTEPLMYAGSLLYLSGVLGAVASIVVRFRRSRGDERQQLRWFATTASVWAVFIVMTFLSELFFRDVPLIGRIGAMGTALGMTALPVAIGIAVLKYRLYDLDVVINRAVLYGALVAIVTLIYLGIVVGIGAAVGRRGNVLLSILATAVIAVAFQPLRERVRRFANRLVYGKRATPYEVMSRFAEGLGAVYSAGEVLPRMARILGEGTGGRTGVWVHVGDELRLAASWPDEDVTLGAVAIGTREELPPIEGWDRTFPVRHHDDLLGALTVSKPVSEPITPAEEKLVHDVAAQAGLVLANVRLIEELRASRQRLVAAQDEERRRLERDIHDGAQQQLVAMAVKLRLARGLAGKDPAKAQEMLDQLQRENQETLETLRDLARGIYPPLLADQGLAAALAAQGRKAAIPVEVVGDGVDRYPQEVEAAAYFSCLEALQNIAKYAEASRAVIRLWSENGTLAFAVEDDGQGFDPRTTPSGSGLRNMGDRLDALGGSIAIRSAVGDGTTVEGRIPVQPALAAAHASESRSGSSSDFGT